MKLESPEARSLMSLLNAYDPHLAIDLHTTNGSYHAYHLTYSLPLHPNTAPKIVDTAARRLAAGDHEDDQGEGWLGLLLLRQPPARAERPAAAARSVRWVTFDHRPRFNNNYLGLRNRIAILSEAYSYLPFDERIAVTRRFVIEILDYAKTRAAEIRRVVEDADKASIVGQTLALRAKTKRAAEPVDILLGGVKTRARTRTRARRCCSGRMSGRSSGCRNGARSKRPTRSARRRRISCPRS